jgi:hypothetical protein
MCTNEVNYFVVQNSIAEVYRTGIKITVVIVLEVVTLDLHANCISANSHNTFFKHEKITFG